MEHNLKNPEFMELFGEKLAKLGIETGLKKPQK